MTREAILTKLLLSVLRSTSSETMKIAVHQPNFLPYLGFFDKVRRVDTFVILDDVQFTKGSYTNRNRIKKPNGTMWLTVPITGNSMVPINQILIANHLDWRVRHLKTLKHMYGNADYYEGTINWVQDIYKEDIEYLAKLNMSLLQVCFELLGIDADIVFSSALQISAEDGSDRILEICQTIGSDRYLSGESGRKYLNEKDFEENGIELSYHGFDHPTYDQQFGEFIPNLSIIDYLMNVGPEKFW